MPTATAAPPAISVRPVCPDDRVRMLNALAYTSANTYYRRFHAPKHRFTERELAYLTQVDGHDHVALIATERDRPDRLVAIARFVRDAHLPTEAELAITVHDPYQRHGIGRQMLTSLVDAARKHGIKCLHANIQFDNEAMIGLLYNVLPQAVLVGRDGSIGEYVADIAWRFGGRSEDPPGDVRQESGKRHRARRGGINGLDGVAEPDHGCRSRPP
jgi:RimJ/RimL family protein N-acetyltransferase